MSFDYNSHCCGGLESILSLTTIEIVQGQHEYTIVFINPLPTIGNSLKKQKSLYKVLTPSIKPPIYILMGLWELMKHICVIGW